MKTFADLQEQAALALVTRDIAEARAAIKAMKEFISLAERDLEKLIDWREMSGHEHP